jgi:hypothetical protein
LHCKARTLYALIVPSLSFVPSQHVAVSARDSVEEFWLETVRKSACCDSATINVIIHSALLYSSVLVHYVQYSTSIPESRVFLKLGSIHAAWVVLDKNALSAGPDIPCGSYLAFRCFVSFVV